MSSQNTHRNYWIGAAFFICLIGMIISLFFTPIIIKDYAVAENSYFFKTFFYGYWKHYRNNSLWSEGGSSELTNFSIISPILIIIGSFSSLILVSILGFNSRSVSQFYKNRNRLLGYLIIICCVIGLIGYLLQLPFFLSFKDTNPEALLGSGFYLGISYFSLLLVIGIPVIFGVKEIRVEQPSYN